MVPSKAAIASAAIVTTFLGATVIFTAANENQSENTLQDQLQYEAPVEQTRVIQTINGEVYEYQSLEDASIITNIPETEIMNNVYFNLKSDEGQFEFK